MLNRILTSGQFGHRISGKCLYLLILVSLVSACGQKGDLYLPEEQAHRTVDSQSLTS